MRVKKQKSVRGIFVVGTDTGVGKTYVACMLARAISRRLKGRVKVFKPYLTGSRADAVKLIRAAASGQSLREVNPFFFRTPLAPFAAARLENKKVVPSLAAAKFRSMSSGADFVVVEGAGGLMVPLTRRFHMLDLIKKLRLGALLVARAGLGTINHTLLSAAALRARGIKLTAVVLNGYTGRNAAERTNPGIIKNYLRTPLFVAGRNSRRPPKGLVECILKNG